jgi:hypothetical protein
MDLVTGLDKLATASGITTSASGRRGASDWLRSLSTFLGKVLNQLWTLLSGMMRPKEWTLKMGVTGLAKATSDPAQRSLSRGPRLCSKPTQAEQLPLKLPPG